MIEPAGRTSADDGQLRPIVGRERELGELDRFLDGRADGFCTLVLDGEVGIGKTTLWEEALRRAAGRSWLVLSTRAAPSEVRMTYIALSDLLAGVPEESLEELPGPQRRALEIALLQAEPEGGPLGQRAVATGFLSLIEAVARASPVLVAVDDAQWLDSASASLLEFVARRLRSQPVGLVLSQRAGEPEPFPLARACAQLVRIEVGPLSLGALHNLIGERLGSPLPRRELVEVERLSGGNPLFALELARAFSDQDGSSGGPPPLPATLGEAVLGRVRALPRSTRDALLVAALAAEPTTRLVDAAALSVAEEASVVRIGRDDTIMFNHPLFAWAVAGSASASQRRAVHARLVSLVENPEERIRHRALAAAGPSEELASELEQPAQAAHARGAPASAANLLSHALRLTPDTNLDAWARRCAVKIPVLLEAGDWERAWTLGQEAIAKLPPGPGRAAVLLEAANRRPGAAWLILQALDEAGGDPMLALRAELMLCVEALYRLDAAASLEHGRAATELARQLGDRPLVALSTTYLGAATFIGGAGNPLPDLDEAMRIEHELGFPVAPAGMSATCYRALWLIYTDELESARATLEGLLRQAIEAGDEGSQAQVLSFVGVVELRKGDWAQAREHIDASIQLADLMEFDQGRSEKRAWLALLQAHQGDLDAARANVAEGMEISEAIGDRLSLVIHLSVLVFISLSIAEPAAALAHIDRIRQVLPTDFDTPVWLEFEGDEIEALVAVGRTSEAEQRIASLERRSHQQSRVRLLVWACRGRSLLLASRGELAGALQALETALGRDDLPHQAPFELARTLLVKGQLERRIKHKAAARDALEQAAGIFDELGAAVWAQTALSELTRLGLRHARNELSETEQRVAKLVAAGKTNRQIAAELFISRRTVEANVARVYRKLDVNSRAGLATLMASYHHDGTA